MAALRALLAGLLVHAASGHGAVTKPTPRKSPEAVYCPWCVGEHQEVANPPARVNRSATPSSPCLGTSRLDPTYERGRWGRYMNVTGPGPSHYVPGEAFEGLVVLDADHNGEAMWSYCPHSEAETEACFQQHPLTHWIDVHDYWGGPSPECTEHCMSGKVFPQRVTLPKDVPQGMITLRWFWVCKNTDEVFLSCIDALVASDDDPAVVSQPTPQPTPLAPTPSGSSVPTSAPVPTPAPVPVPTPPGACAGAWKRCGGDGWTGPTCCDAGWLCDFQSVWHSQCEQIDPSSPLPSPQPSPQPEPNVSVPTPAPAPVTESPTPSPASVGGYCSCNSVSAWNGNFGQFGLENGTDFCKQNFGSLEPFISAGGGSDGGGGWSGLEPCKSGQYNFTEEEGWHIAVSASQGAGSAPYRAFANAQFCHGKSYSECLDGPFSFSFSFKVQGASELAAFVKLLFWTDNAPLVGLLPPAHPKGAGKLRLVAFMENDYPNSWGAEAEVEEGKSYHLTFDFTPSDSHTKVAIIMDGSLLGTGSMPFDALEETFGPQIGIYSFDYSNSGWPQQGLHLWVDDVCLGSSSGTCPSGSDSLSRHTASEPEPEPEPEPESDSPSPHTTSEPELGPEPKPEVTPEAAEPEPAGQPEPDSKPPLKYCCAAASQQCGGVGWTGSSCCQHGSTCIVQSEQQWQCVVDGELTDAMTRAPFPSSLSMLAGCASIAKHAQEVGHTTKDAVPLARKRRKVQHFLSPALIQLKQILARGSDIFEIPAGVDIEQEL